MAHKFDTSARHKLNSEQRRSLLMPEGTLSRLGFKKGDIMADIGCGTGIFTVPAAKLTEPQKVYAVDISQQMLDEVAHSAQGEGLQNIVPVKSGEYDFGLADETADFILLCTVLHEIEDKPRLLTEAIRICRSGGTIAVIEFNETNIAFGPPLSHRLPRAQSKALLERAGFAETREFTISEAFYALTAKKQK